MESPLELVVTAKDVAAAGIYSDDCPLAMALMLKFPTATEIRVDRWDGELRYFAVVRIGDEEFIFECDARSSEQAETWDSISEFEPGTYCLILE